MSSKMIQKYLSKVLMACAGHKNKDTVLNLLGRAKGNSG